MEELLENIEHVPYAKARNLILLDTCFIINTLGHKDKLKQLLEIDNLGVTSFNIEELLYVEHKLNHEIRKGIRKFLKEGKFKILDIPVHPGNHESEKEFVREADNELLLKIADHSDAVLIATAIKTHSIILTKDKHHLFTTVLENFVQKYDIKVYKDLHEL